MDSLLLIAAGIPFVLFAAVFVILATVRFRMTDTLVRVSVLGFTLRSVPISEVTSVEHIEKPGHGLPGILSMGETVVIRHGADGAVFTVLTKQPELFVEALRARVKEETGRDV